MSTNIKTWYDFILQQMAAESYLDQSVRFGGTRTVSDVVMLGSNNPSYMQNNKIPQPADAILNGATRMTATQAADFTSRFTIIDHRSNDDPRFASA